MVFGGLNQCVNYGLSTFHINQFNSSSSHHDRRHFINFHELTFPRYHAISANIQRSLYLTISITNLTSSSCLRVSKEIILLLTYIMRSAKRQFQRSHPKMFSAFSRFDLGSLESH